MAKLIPVEVKDLVPNTEYLAKLGHTDKYIVIEVGLVPTIKDPVGVMEIYESAGDPYEWSIPLSAIISGKYELKELYLIEDTSDYSAIVEE